MRFKIRVSCEDCDGYGVVSDRHPNDPSARDIPCRECDGKGEIEYQETYDSIADAKEDYPKAIAFSYL
jgi:DnaJ-class molecular chaperone